MEKKTSVKVWGGVGHICSGSRRWDKMELNVKKSYKRGKYVPIWPKREKTNYAQTGRSIAWKKPEDAHSSQTLC